ncbi:LysM peptidoglycan-binding domain-containing protein [Pseudomonas aeruginosa]|uniref:LysM peptidoglycan-binding domain-containing protein n=1 Tax=Pseudomonas aeruginosa TaxID=287 RepID=UPI0034D261AA
MSSTQHQLIEQCATRLRGIIEALDNIHDTSPHRWSTDLDDVHSSAESLLALINDQAPPSDAERWREQFDCMQLQRDHHRERADAALARVAELEHVLRVVVNAADHGSWPTTVMHGIEKVREVLAGSAPPAKAQHSVPAYVSYTTRPAESLAGIALRQLKDESRWVEIRDINAHTFPDMQSHSYYPAGTVIKLPAAAPGKEVPQAWLDVQAERRRQVEVEGYHGFRDSHYISYELSKAARAYIEVSWHALSGGLPCKQPESWPWMAGFKWSDGRTMLVKACALTLAEIERLDRAAASQGGPSDA